MNRTLTALAGIFFGAASALGQATTSPSSQTVIISADNPTKVLIAPFKQVGDTSGRSWVAAALREDLISATNQNPQVRAETGDHAWADSEIGDALNVARQANAGIVVFGSYQVNSDQLRITGEAADVSSGKVLATLGATGNLQDLFKMEDTLAEQLQSVLPNPNQGTIIGYNPNPNNVDTSQNPNLPQDVSQYSQSSVAAPTQVPYQAPAYTSSIYAYTPPVYDYSSYGYDNGYYSGWPIVIYSGGGYEREFCHGDNHRDFDHRGSYQNRGYRGGVGFGSGARFQSSAGIHIGISAGRTFGNSSGHGFSGGHR